MSDPEQLWHQRQEIPDPQIRDAADQYEGARKLLLDQPLGSGVLLPLINNATIAIELYLKSLSAQLVHTPVGNFPGLNLVTTKPSLKGHRLVALLDELPDTLIQEIESAFARERDVVAIRSFKQALEECEGAFADSRYPFEPGADISAYPLSVLMLCSCFLAKFVSELPPSERIEWKKSRVLTAFENDLRSDLLSGRADRWDVSSPRDELEKFKFFVRQIETLIDQAEESEVSSLQASIAGLSKEAQDEFWPYYYPTHWDEIFRSNIRNSVVVSLATFLETFIDRLCTQVALITRSDLRVGELKGATLDRARRYLNAVGKFEEPQASAWDEVGLFFKIRNVLVHSGGFTLGSNYEKAIEQFCRQRSDIQIKYGSIEIEPEFLEFVIVRLIALIEKLEDEFSSLCEKTRQAESI